MRLIDATELNGYKFGLISPYVQNLFHQTINEAPTVENVISLRVIEDIKEEIRKEEKIHSEYGNMGELYGLRYALSVIDEYIRKEGK